MISTSFFYPYQNGGPGTVFLQDLSADYSLLFIDGNGEKLSYLPIPPPVIVTLPLDGSLSGTIAWITDPLTSSFTFNEVQVINYGGLAIQPASSGNDIISYLSGIYSSLFIMF